VETPFFIDFVPLFYFSRNGDEMFVFGPADLKVRMAGSFSNCLETTIKNQLNILGIV